MISVLLAAHCGETYIAEQIASILPQLEDGDELLVSDDSPPGHVAVREIVASFNDPRVCYVTGPRQGTTQANIEFLLGQANGDILVLSDQDDTWLPGKLDVARQALGSAKPALLLHNAYITDEALHKTGQTLFQARNAKPGLLRNLLRNSYTGCCMAFTKELLPCILPFPKNIPMHDQYIGLCAQRHGHVQFWDEPLLLWRRHGGTQTGQGSTLAQKLKWRWNMASALIKTSKGECR